MSHKIGRAVWHQLTAGQAAPTLPDQFVEASPSEPNDSIVANLASNSPRRVYLRSEIQNIAFTANEGG